MRMTLIQLHHNGVPLTKDEIAAAPRYTGNFLIEDTRRDDGHGRRYYRIAKLCSLDPGISQHELLLPLFDPVCVKVDDRRMTFHGYQFHAEGGTVTHFAQYWVLRAAD